MMTLSLNLVVLLTMTTLLVGLSQAGHDAPKADHVGVIADEV